MKKQYRANGRKVARKRLSKASDSSYLDWVVRKMNEIRDGIIGRQQLKGAIGIQDKMISPRPGVPSSLIASGAIPIREKE